MGPSKQQKSGGAVLNTILSKMQLTHLRKPTLRFAFAFFCFYISLRLRAELLVVPEPAKQVGRKVVIPLAVTNNYPERVESARATIFLFDDSGKLTGQASKWILSAEKGKPSLEPQKGIVFHFTLETERPFSTNRIILNRVVLEGGKLAPIDKSNNPAPGEKQR